MYRSNFSVLLLLLSVIILFSCSKEDPAGLEKPFPVDGGTDQANVNGFTARLNADDLEPKQFGSWSIISGLIDEKVFFDDDEDPKTRFHGLPGITYKLQWQVLDNTTVSQDTIEITFAPLQTNIEDVSPFYYQTRKYLKAKTYDRGLWTVEGDEYHSFSSQLLGGTYVPDNESGDVKFYGHENKNYKLIWTTWYGSISAKDSIEFETSNYHQYEALERIHILNKPNYYKLDNDGNVVELYLGGDSYGTVFDDLENYPSLKSLVHLKWLNISGNALNGTIEVVGHYKNLEYLNLGHNYLTGLPENIGDLKKLDTLILEHMQAGYEIQSLPESFGELESLRYLNLFSLGLTTVPESFANLTNLEYLDMEGNFIEKLPHEIGNLAKLRTFRGPVLNTNLPESVSKLKSLEFFFVDINHSEPRLPENFGNLHKLETFWFKGHLSELPQNFTELASIKDLNLGFKPELETPLPATFGNLTTLEKLILAGGMKSLPQSIGNLINLKFLEVAGSLENLPPAMGNLTQLEYLNLRNMQISGLPEEIGNLKNLTHLYLGYNQIVEIPENIGNLSSLYKLDLSNNLIESIPQSIEKLDGHLYEFYVGENKLSEEQVNQLKSWLPNVNIYSW